MRRSNKISQGKYGLLLKQEGEGCDYSIGCGMTLLLLKAPEKYAARDEAFAILMDENHVDHLIFDNDKDDNNGPTLESAYVVELDHELPIHDWYRELGLISAKSVESRRLQEQRKLYERLKKVFEDER